MARLPVVNSDTGVWGDRLLEYLLVAHNGDGTPRDGDPGAVAVLAYAARAPIGDGGSHPLSDLFGTLADARATFPHAVALTDEVGWAATQAAFVAARSTPTGLATMRPVALAPGTVRINRGLVLDNARGGTLFGAGRASSLLSWYGDSATPLLAVTNCREMLLRDFGIVADPARPLLCGVAQARTVSSGAWSPTNNTYERVTVDGTQGGAASGVYTAFASGVGLGLTAIDTNNDFTLWDHCFASNYRDQGWTIAGTQNYYNELRRCRAASGGGQYGVVLGGRAGLTWTGGGLFAHTGADFSIDDPNPYSIVRLADFTSESSKRLLYLNSVNGGSVVVEGVRYAGDNVDADGEFIQVPTHVGHLTVQNNHFLERHATNQLRLRWGTTPPNTRGTGGSFTFERNIWWQNGNNRTGAPVDDATFWVTNRPSNLGAGNQIKNEITMGSIAMVA